MWNDDAILLSERYYRNIYIIYKMWKYENLLHCMQYFG